MVHREMGIGATLDATILTPQALRDVRQPSDMGDVARWAKDAAPYLKAVLGVHPDDMFSRQVLQYMHDGQPRRSDMPGHVRVYRAKNFPNLWRGLRRIMLAEALGIAHIYGALYARILDEHGDELFLKTLVSLRVVTNAGVADLVDAFTNTFELENYNYHGIGTGTNAEQASDTNLQTALTTQLSPDNTRATGTQSQPSANVYQSVGTNTVDAPVAITEHGLFSHATVGSGNLFDRSVFGALNLTSGNQLETTWQGTFPAGS